MKEKPLDSWAKANNKKYGIVGIMREEGGRRMTAECLSFRDGKLWHFQPLSIVTKDWEAWFIDRFKIELAPLYYQPYNFIRTGCKGCPFALHLQEELDTIEKFFPAERKQCEYIWKPIYEEYRRIGYRKMRPLDEGRQTTIEEFLENLKQEEQNG
jgi:3'-phosphoadenosine 5'-phosphosulfate sulfotransferase (PAPS reductase)/FAD synthetase